MANEEPNKHEITGLLRAWSEGDEHAADGLLPLVYDELHRQAARYLFRERRDHTLQTTALINEAFIKIVGQKNVKWANRSHFFGLAAQAMRRILVDYARARQTNKRGGKEEDVALDDVIEIAGEEEMSTDLIALDEALNRLASLDEQAAKVVELRYFSGLTLDDTAEALNISRATAARDWAMAKVFLKRELTRDGDRYE